MKLGRPLRGEKSIVVKFETRHVAEVTRLHLKAFPGFFLTFMGAGFLRHFYNAFLFDSGSIAWVVESDRREVIAFAVGSVAPSGFFKRLLRQRWWAFAATSLAAVCRNPRIVPRLLRALRYRGDVPDSSRRALLSSIAVDPVVHGQGVGGMVLERWLEEARQRGCQGCYLTTDAAGNEAVNRFYLRNGWRIDATYSTPEGRVMNRYVIDFVSTPAFSSPSTSQK